MKRLRPAFFAVLLSLPGVAAFAQGLELSGGAAVTVNSSAEAHVQSVTNDGTVTLTSSTLFVSGDFDNTGTVTANTSSVAEFNGTANQEIRSDAKLTFGKLRPNNAGLPGMDNVTMLVDVDCDILDVNEGVFRVASSRTLKATSTSDSETDPMVSVREGGTLSVGSNATLSLASGTLIVYPDADEVVAENGVLELRGGTAEPATIDATVPASPYSLSMRGTFAGSGFQILHPDSKGLEVKSVSGDAPPMIKEFVDGKFDYPVTSGSLIDLTSADPVLIDPGTLLFYFLSFGLDGFDSEASFLPFQRIRFENTDSASGAVNVKTGASTEFKDAFTGLPIPYVLFREHEGGLSGESNDSEPVSTDLARWTGRPDPPTLLTQKDWVTDSTIDLGGELNSNAVKLSAKITHPDGHKVRLGVVAFGNNELSPTEHADFKYVETSDLVASGTTVELTIFGLVSGEYQWEAWAEDEYGARSVRVSFGGNIPDTTDFDFYVEETNQVPDISNLEQYKADASTVIADAGTTNETTVVFKATVDSNDGLEDVKLQVWVLSVNSFGSGTDKKVESSLVTSGSTAQATATGLTEADYKWLARAIDENGNASTFAEFEKTPFEEEDFRVVTNVEPPVITTATKKTNDNTPTISGTAVADSTVEVFANGVSIGTDTATGGSWSVTPSALSDGGYLVTAKATVTPNTSASSGSITITVDTEAPDAPAELKLVTLDTAMVLIWTASTASDTFGYHVYRKLNSEGEGSWTKITTDPVIGTRYIDRGLTNGTDYDYKVSAVDDALDEAP